MDTCELTSGANKTPLGTSSPVVARMGAGLAIGGICGRPTAKSASFPWDLALRAMPVSSASWTAMLLRRLCSAWATQRPHQTSRVFWRHWCKEGHQPAFRVQGFFSHYVFVFFLFYFFFFWGGGGVGV